MRKTLLLIAIAGVTALVTGVGSNSLPLQAQAGIALTGRVTSAEAGPMEGVGRHRLGGGSTISVSVVTNDQGRYNFPTSKLYDATTR